MPREKQFDETAVLGKAMEAFWARGYEATSVRDLVEAMGLHRGSIYAAFGGKRSLFLKALRHYETHRRRAWLEALRRRHGPRAAILSVFEGAQALLVPSVWMEALPLVTEAVETTIGGKSSVTAGP